MPISYLIDPARRRVYTTGTATVRGAEVLDAQRRLAADPAFHPTYSQLFDLTGVEQADVSANDIRAMAESTVFGRGSRRALVAKKPLLYGLTRMFQILVDARGGDIEVFTDLETAERWLDTGSGSPSPRPDDAVSLGETDLG